MESENKEKTYISSIRMKEILLGDPPKTEQEKSLINHITKNWGIDLNKKDEKFYKTMNNLIWGVRKVELKEGAIPQNEREKHYIEVEVPESRARMNQMWEDLAKGIQKLEEDKKAFEELLIKYGKYDYVEGGKFKSEEFKKLFDKVCEKATKKVLRKTQKGGRGVSTTVFNRELEKEIRRMLPLKYKHYKLTEKDMPPNFKEEFFSFLKERDAMKNKNLIINDYFF